MFFSLRNSCYSLMFPIIMQNRKLHIVLSVLNIMLVSLPPLLRTWVWYLIIKFVSYVQLKHRCTVANQSHALALTDRRYSSALRPSNLFFSFPLCELPTEQSNMSSWVPLLNTSYLIAFRKNHHLATCVCRKL